MGAPSKGKILLWPEVNNKDVYKSQEELNIFLILK